ncbi:MAG: hypothetical protein WBM23_06300 [Desulfomonilia bacterium]
MRFIWRNLPVFFIWLVGLSMLNNSLHHISPPVESVRLLSFFSLAAALVLLWYACRKDYGDDRMLKPFVAWAVILAGLYLTPFMHGLSLPLDESTQRLWYELSALAQFAILLVHGRTWLARWDWVWVFGVTLAFGAILENGGIVLRFFSEPGYLLYFPGLPAPVATTLGWVNVLYCAFFAVEKLLPPMPAVAKGLICALIGLSLDIPFDPVATRLGWWVWDPSLSAKIWDVPMVNFIAWFWALFPYGTAYYWVRQWKNYGDGRKVLLLVGSFPVILMVEFLGVVASLSLAGDRESLFIFERFFSSLGLM